MSLRFRLIGLGVVGALAFTPGISAQSLAEVARREAERRKNIKSSGKVYTNEDLRSSGGVLTTGAPPAEPPKTPGAAPASGPAADQPGAQPSAAPPAPEDPRKSEAFWRERITAARQQLARLQLFDQALDSRINGLWAEFTARDDPAQRAVIERDRQLAMAEKERVRVEIEQATKQIAAIEEEARRAAVPPGWLR